MNQPTTICAIATAPGGALGIVRVSGPEAITITNQIFLSPKGVSLEKCDTHTLSFGAILDTDGQLVDEVLVSVFRTPHSYTGENAVEISCHGSPYILQKVMELLMKKGCEVAQPGEFTQRAFLAGKMDLSQAEAVADVIAADSAVAHRLAIGQMRGGVSAELHMLRDRLLQIASLLELELDFSDHEDLEFADRTELTSLAEHIAQRLTTLIKSFSLGNALKNGIPVAIVGDTNAGKSTLLNQLLGEEKAIVSDIRGTTRDVIEDVINIEGITFRLIDTAGIRHTSDTIEQLGIERTFDRIRNARIVLWLLDATEATAQYATLAPQILPLCADKHLFILLNKIDRQHKSTSLSNDNSQKIIPISALTGEGLEYLRQEMLQVATLPETSQTDLLITNARHHQSLYDALQSINRVCESLSLSLSGDLIAQDLRECIHHLGTIIGEVTSDEILHNIFKNFCIGK